MQMQRRSVEGSLGLCKVLGDFVPMGFRASVCIYLLNTNCLQDGKRIGVPLWSSYGFWAGCWMYERTVQASGLKQGGGSARRAVSASDLSAGTNTISPDLRHDTHTLK